MPFPADGVAFRMPPDSKYLYGGVVIERLRMANVPGMVTVASDVIDKGKMTSDVAEFGITAEVQLLATSHEPLPEIFHVWLWPFLL
jgi:hypothetical protein